MKRVILLLFITLLPVLGQAQSTFVPYNPDYYHLIDRFQIKYQNKDNLLHSTFKPIRRSDLAPFLNHVQQSYDSLSAQDQFNLRYLLNDNWFWSKTKYNENDKTWWDLFYNKRSDFYYYQTDNFKLRVNPVLYLTGGKDNQEEDILYTNTRGLEASGMIDNKIGFYTFLTTTQAQFPLYVTDYIKNRRAFPNEGFWKEIQGSQRVYDFFHARGYLTFGLTKSIHVQAGYDKQFIGNGIRSMILSDFSSPNLFLKLQTQIGPFQYTNLFAELTEDLFFSNVGTPIDGDYPNKFMASHRLGLQLNSNIEIGVFEMILANSATLDYFNPIVFYRAIEQNRGSPDNILIGLDFKADLKAKYQVYGQITVDEFLVEALRSGNGDWRNKYAVQLGAKWIDALEVNNLDLQLEYNSARPFIFAYDEPALSFTNYRNPLAHPFGANFKELILAARYQPMNKLQVNGRLVRTNYGEDSADISFGADLLRSTNDRPGNLGNSIGQGIGAVNTYLEVTGTYQVMHNIFVDAQVIYRNFNSDDNTRDQRSFIPSISLRWNVARRQHVF